MSFRDHWMGNINDRLSWLTDHSMNISSWREHHWFAPDTKSSDVPRWLSTIIRSTFNTSFASSPLSQVQGITGRQLLHWSVLVIRCFNEPCVDDSPCTTNGLRCHFAHCLCPVGRFWAGDQKKCMECPAGWLNLGTEGGSVDEYHPILLVVAFCIHYEKSRTDWLGADRQCRDRSTVIGIPTRLLELHNRNEFEFIQGIAGEILTNDQMTFEANHSLGSLSSTIAFVGSRGHGRFPGSQLI